MNQVTVRSVKLVSLSQPPNGELSPHVCRICDSCGKNFTAWHRINDRLSPNGYYCSFCLRHRLHTKNACNILGLSFRAIVGYYYYEHHQQPYARHKMWLSEIKDFIDSHAETGLLNPLFAYDPETLLWFVDFNRVGQSKRKVRVEEILKTVVNILACFNLSEEVPGLKLVRFFSKFKDAIIQFHTKRYRPADKRLLIPTFSGCLNVEPRQIDRTRNITLSEMSC